MKLDADLRRGEVPAYPDFVRHVWAHRAPDTGAPVIDGPPWVYTLIVDNDAEWRLVERVVNKHQKRGRIRVETLPCERKSVHQVDFADLESLHRFLSVLAAHHHTYGTAAAHEITEFVMWTLGFRWV